MSRAFIRQYEIILQSAGKKDIIIASADMEDPLHITFKVAFGGDVSKTGLALLIYNLGEQTLNYLYSDPNLGVTLRVGYRNNPIQTLFRGTLEAITTDTEGNGIRTSLRVKSGKALGEITVERSFKGDKIYKLDVLDALMGDIYSITQGGISVPTRTQLEKFDDKTYYTRGYTYKGRMTTTLRRILEFMGLQFTCMDNEIVISRVGQDPKYIGIEQSGGFLSGIEDSLDTSAVGQVAAGTAGISDTLRTSAFIDRVQRVMDSAPRAELGKNMLQIPVPVGNDGKKASGDSTPSTGVKFKMFMDPTLRPTQSIVINSDKGDHVYDNEIHVIQKVDFSGSYEGNDWTATVETRALDASIQTTIASAMKLKEQYTPTSADAVPKEFVDL